MAVGTLAIGLTFIAGTFLTGIFFATLSTERTIAAVAAEEAFAKVQIYGLGLAGAGLKSSGFTAYEDLVTLPAEESMYPSIREETASQYSWSAICRRVEDANDPSDPNVQTDDDELVQCTVFVSRETGGNPSYWKRKNGTASPDLESVNPSRPRPLLVNVAPAATPTGPEEIAIKDAVPGDTTDERTFVSEGSILVDDATGAIYRVMERSAVSPDKVTLDRPWAGSALTSAAGGWAWVVAPAASGGRNPGIAVYQKLIKFPRGIITDPR